MVILTAWGDWGGGGGGGGWRGEYCKGVSEYCRYMYMKEWELHVT